MTETDDNNANAPLIDIIIPVYNGERFVCEAIDSACKQTHQNIRIIVVNDGSTDGSREKILALTGQLPNLVFVDRPHCGVSATLNTALEHTEADWLAFLDCDDLWATNKLQVQLAVLTADQSLDICFTKLQEFDDESAFNTTYRARPEPLAGINKTSMLCRRSLFDRVGGFNEALQMGDFIEWFNRCKTHNVKHVVLPDVLAFRRIHDNNMTNGVSAVDYLKVIRLHLNSKRQVSGND
ncbi:glycosyltransferase family A protein [uncultured Porticoccus sp.]|jgi:glycosyltransferase involved in cell wall biosynthesis|uniref:glycosyltransferase family 2 protein n=1 Tax=Porticoccus sp. TaxID=2024853 RepID=UPI0030D8486D|tara:strand:+ start:5690 stop:6403 length:714 start_codon:yes stop_codon:yes gene_type:complete